METQLQSTETWGMPVYIVCFLGTQAKVAQLQVKKDRTIFCVEPCPWLTWQMKLEEKNGRPRICMNQGNGMDTYVPFEDTQAEAFFTADKRLADIVCGAYNRGKRDTGCHQK